MALKRYPNGAEGEFFFQKRAETPARLDRTVELRFLSGRTAEEVVSRTPQSSRGWSTWAAST